MRNKFCVIFVFVLCLFGSYTFACTVFMSTDGQLTFFGNNEDGPLETAVMKFIPASKKEYGRFFFELIDNPNPLIRKYPQGGMNDQGLAFDITATPLKKPQELIIPENTPYCQGNLMKTVLAKAATVEEAIEIIKKYKASEIIRKKYNQSEFRQIQVFLADKTGDSAVIGIGKNNRLTVTRKYGRFQVLANFNIANYENSLISERYRYDTATEMLKQNKPLTIKYFRKILSAVHTEGLAATIYSTIYNLNQGKIYLYNFHDYENVVEMNLQNELNKGKHSFKISSRFPRKVFAEIATKEFSAKFYKLYKLLEKYKKQVEYCKKYHQNQ